MKSLFALALLCCGCAAPQVRQFHAPLMHTQWDFQLSTRSEAQAERAFEQARALVQDLDQKLAMWQPASELAKLNATAGSGRSVTVSAALADCLAASLSATALSGGASDPTVGPLTRAWWKARQDKRLLRPAELKKLRALQGVDKVHFEAGPPPTVRLDQAGMQLDFGSVAKGYAQDRVAELLRKMGIDSFLLNAGGQVYAAGRKPGGQPWRVAIQDPRDPGRVISLVDLSDACLSTSGDYEQVSVIEGKRVHHILDPASGRSVEGMASVSVLVPLAAHEGRCGLTADAAGTAAFVLTGKKGLDYLKGLGLDGLVVTEKNGRLAALVSGRFEQAPLELEH